MSNSNYPRNIEFGGPASYRIVVKGALSETSRRRFSGMTIETIQKGEESVISTLTGPVMDQAELRGVLDALFGLHLSVISIEQCHGD